jgi:hypothetical protein
MINSFWAREMFYCSTEAEKLRNLHIIAISLSKLYV